MYGTQTSSTAEILSTEFENDVKMYGTQTVKAIEWHPPMFENDVKMYGTQTIIHFFHVIDFV